MAKVGTAHVEIKPVLFEEALEEMAEHIEDRIARAVAAGIRRGMRERRPIVDPWEGARW